MYIIIAVSTLSLATILSEMNFPIVPNIFRVRGTKINTLYKLLVPLILVSFGVYLQRRMLENNAEEFCRINPEAHGGSSASIFYTNCYDLNTASARSMEKCGLGLRCFLNGKEIREIKEQSNPFKNFECRKDFTKCGDYIKPGFLLRFIIQFL